MSFLESLHPVMQALLAAAFTWAMTALGATVVFTRAGLSRRTLGVSLGFAGGVMIAASYWSLLAPAIEMTRGGNTPVWLPAVTGFLVGAFFLRVSTGYCRTCTRAIRRSKPRVSVPAGERALCLSLP